MIEPLAVGVHSVYTLAQVRPNQIVAVFGAGPVGLLAMAVARACGARRVIAIDIMESRLRFSKTYAATDIFCPPAINEGESRMAYSKRSSETLKRELGVADAGVNGVDVIIEASGAEVCIQTGYHLIKPGGVFVQVGAGALNVQVPVHLLLSKEIVVKGSFRCILSFKTRIAAHILPDMAQAIILSPSPSLPMERSTSSLWLHTGLSQFLALRCHWFSSRYRFAFDDAVMAFEVTQKRQSEDGKGVIKAIIDGPL